MRTYELFSLQGWIIKSEYQTHQGETVLDLGEVSDRPPQQRGLGTHEVINGCPLRKNFYKIVDLRDGMIDMGVAL